ncbi:hypothetical protein [uncultured Maribacter sp.]|uniref:hypothetical protein n=1 Tax=uncultured Maribacter sp. TaxID=431308 RepID=UPI002626718A|nr:hypothetical protein [uncultured Maribacter sp.]
MKSIITLLFIIFISVASFAKNLPEVQKVSTITKGIVLEQTTLISFKNIKEIKKNAVTRLYMSKNSRIMKELSFATKRNRHNQA